MGSYYAGSEALDSIEAQEREQEVFLRKARYSGEPLSVWSDDIFPSTPRPPLPIDYIRTGRYRRPTRSRGPPLITPVPREDKVLMTRPPLV